MSEQPVSERPVLSPEGAPREVPPGRSEAARRRRAVARAGHLGDLVSARAALGDDDGGVRATALTALARLGHLTDDHLRAALTDAQPRVRRRAAALAADHPHVSLLAALDDPEPLVAETAAFACGERPTADVDVVDALARLATGHPDPLVREAAVAALGAIGDERGLPAVLAATHDKPAVRRRAVIALAPFDGPEVEAALVRARTDRDWQVRDAADELS